MTFDLEKAKEQMTDGGDDEPQFGDDMTVAGFKAACREYAEWAVEHYDAFDEISLEDVDFEVSKKMKRTAGKAMQTKSGEDRRIRFAWGAYQEWGWNEEMRSAIRHELVHIQDYQTRGESGHGILFESVADKVNAPRHCQQFTDYKYGIFCKECDELVAGRYRACKMTRQPDRYESKCCSASCYSERL